MARFETTSPHSLKEIADWRNRKVGFRYDPKGSLIAVDKPEAKNNGDYASFDHTGGSRPTVHYTCKSAGTSLQDFIDLAGDLESIREPSDMTARVTFHYDPGAKRDFVAVPSPSSGRLPAMIERVASLTTCTNCGAEVADVYCARCGERQPGHHDLSVGHFAHEVFHELAHVDSKLVTTLRDLLTRPGFLTEEYFGGRKSRYIAPLRLFLTLFALQFLAFTFYAPAALYSVRSMKRFDKAGALTTLINRRARQRHLTAEEFEDRLDERWHKNYSLLQLANILGVAIVLKVLHRRRYLAEHLVFAAHLLAFSYIMTMVVDWPVYAIAGFKPGPVHQVVQAITIGIQLVYLFFAQRRFYGDDPAPAAFKTVLLWGGRFAVTVVLIAGSLIAAVLMAR